jgi:hypothetical protein
MSLGVTWPEGDFYRRCPMCGFYDSPGYPWEEKLVRMSNCPRDGVPLERLACQSCGAPVVVEESRGGFFSFGGTSQLPYCGYCGEPVTRVEPKMRERPATAQPPPNEIDHHDSVLFRLAGLSPMLRGHVRIVYDNGETVRAADPMQRRREACEFKKADAACRCAPCKAVRRHYRKRAR